MEYIRNIWERLGRPAKAFVAGALVIILIAIAGAAFGGTSTAQNGDFEVTFYNGDDVTCADADLWDHDWEAYAEAHDAHILNGGSSVVDDDGRLYVSWYLFGDAETAEASTYAFVAAYAGDGETGEVCILSTGVKNGSVN